jgi:phosphatidylinositol kinase/protein kinase (PI-3  family)
MAATGESISLASKVSYRQYLGQLPVLTYRLGHEDLRQDERAMQLFGLVNTLLSQDPDSFKRALHIQRYPIIPLAPNVGLMGWVQQTETLHVLIRDYRGELPPYRLYV